MRPGSITALRLSLTGSQLGSGLTAKKPIHELRKEFGSMVNRAHGLSAARDQLRHGDYHTVAGELFRIIKSQENRKW
jgi:hypothetical protein